MPSDLAEQIPFVHQACEALGVQVLTFVGFEADDVIGTLAMRAVAEGRPVAIVTGDKDFFQLVNDTTGVRVFNPRDEGAWYDAEGVKAKFGVAPEQVVDVLALMGDSIDNIKGRSRHRREGRARSDLDARLARRAAGECAVAQRQEARAADDACRRGAREPRAAANSHRRAAAGRRRVVLRLPRTRSPEVFRAVLRARVPFARHRVRADCRHRRRRLRRRLNGTRS